MKAFFYNSRYVWLLLLCCMGLLQTQAQNRFVLPDTTLAPNSSGTLIGVLESDIPISTMTFKIPYDSTQGFRITDITKGAGIADNADIVLDQNDVHEDGSPIVTWIVAIFDFGDDIGIPTGEVELVSIEWTTGESVGNIGLDITELSAVTTGESEDVVFDEVVTGTVTESSPPSIPTATVELNEEGNPVVSWTNDSDLETSFRIERSIGDPTNFQELASVEADITEYIDTDIESNTTYFYRVVAIGEQGESMHSNEESITTPFADISAPSNLTVVNYTNNTLKLEWADNAGNEHKQVLERSTNPTEGFEVLDVINANRTSYVDGTVGKATRYYYRLKAIGEDDGHESEYSNIDDGTTIDLDVTLGGPDNHTIFIPTNVGSFLDGEVLEAGDWVAGFFTSEDGTQICGGAVRWSSTQRADLTLWQDNPRTSEKDGFEGAEDIIIKVYKQGEWYEVSAVYQQTGNVNSTDGKYRNSGLSGITSLETCRKATLELAPGFNLKSTWVYPNDPTFEAIFETVKDISVYDEKGSLLFAKENNSIQAGVEQKAEWDSLRAYKIDVLESVDIELCGRKLNPQMVMELPKSETYRSYRPFPGEMSADVRLALGQDTVHMYHVQVVRNDNGSYIPYNFMIGGEDQIVTFLPMEGIKFTMLDTVENFSFPEGVVMRTAGGRKNILRTEARHFEKIKPNEIDNMTLAIPVSVLGDGIMLAEDEIAVIDSEGQVVDAKVVEGNLIYLTLWKDNGRTAEKEGFQEGETFSIRYWSSMSGEEKELELTLKGKQELSFTMSKSLKIVEGLAIKQEIEEKPIISNLQLYPNPAQNELSVAIPNHFGSTAVSLISIDGKIVLNRQLDAGVLQELKIDNLSHGVYMLRLVTEAQEVIVKKLLIQP